MTMKEKLLSENGHTYLQKMANYHSSISSCAVTPVTNGLENTDSSWSAVTSLPQVQAVGLVPMFPACEL